MDWNHWIRIVAMVCILHVVTADSVFWAVWEPRRICGKMRRLRGKTLRICQNEKDVVKAIKEGASVGLGECKHQFRNRRWNCTADKRSLKKILLKATRETGFLNAITAAGMTYKVTQACTLGSLNDCPCDRTTSAGPVLDPSVTGGGQGSIIGGNGGTQHGSVQINPNGGNQILETNQYGWGGCGENVQYGYEKSKAFLEERFRKRSDLKTMILRHNYEAGRMAVKNYMRTTCKCHGMSGSCTVKSCWRKLPPFRDVGNRIKERFDGAAKVTAGNDGKTFVPEGGATIKFPETEDIVYAEESPNFCVANRTTGSLGTTGRLCNHTSMGVEGCELLCCGRGHVMSRVNVSYNCRCRFQWCCDVKCETCHDKRTISQCL